MKPFKCRCGWVVYFDDHRCGNCHRELAFDPSTLEMQSEPEPGEGLSFCTNRSGVSLCNWLAARSGTYCPSCLMSKVIPALSKPENHERWRKLELAKRRLLYDLLSLRLPVDPARMRFSFKEDRRTNPDVLEEHVAIGHNKGVITINAAEADAVYRETMRVSMKEKDRTLLGHFRHESGHYYFGVILDESQLAAARHLFGDERLAYQEALRNYYINGPMAAWNREFISAYASAHPAEDWAETWAHYLHIRATLETAHTNGLLDSTPGANWKEDFIGLMISINEVMRGLGLPDAYSYIFTDKVSAKIDFVHEAVLRFTDRQGETSQAET